MDLLPPADVGLDEPLVAPTNRDLITRYQEIVQQSADVITLVTASGTIDYQSPSVDRVLGYAPDELVGEEVFDSVHPDDRDRVRSALAAAAEAPPDTVHEAEYRFRHADGSWVWLASVASRRPDSEEFVVNSREITALREARASLEAEHDRYQTIVEGVNDAIIIHIGGQIRFGNERAHEVLGLSPGELMGQSIERYIAEDDVEIVVERYLKRLDPASESPPSRYEIELTTTNGDRLVGEINARAIEYEGEQAVLVAVRDVTEQSRYEDELQERNEELEALNRVVRHDIRNDMSVILGWIELMEPHVDGTGREYLEKVLRSGQHIVELTEIARDFIDTLTSDAEAELSAIDLRTVLEDELERRRELFPDATFEVDGELPDVAIQANEMVTSVFTNLLNNAVQHNPTADPNVWLSATTDEGVVEVRVSENGPGVPDAAKERIFGKGERGLESEGTGIGLYLVRTLVEQYHGSVHVEDNEPSGAVFVVRLPLADE